MSAEAASRKPKEVEILIVGAGPTGLVGANLLGQAGIRTLLIEQASGLSAIPKALMVDNEFFRLLHKLGLGEKLSKHGVYPVGYDYYSPLGPRVGHIAGRITEHGFPSRTATYQPEFEQILFDGLDRFSSVEVLFDRKLESFTDESALGERKPDIVSMDPSWHHNYASLGWCSQAANSHAAHYPSIKPELVQLTSALHALAHEADQRTEYVKDPAAFADNYQLSPEQRAALIEMNMPAFVKMGTHPLVPFLANMHIQRLRNPR